MRYSESIAKIGAAIVAFQRDISNPLNTAKNPYYNSKYAPLPDILNHCRASLAKAGLAAVQNVVGNGQHAGVVTTLLHESGEFIEGDPVLLPIAPRTDKKTGESYIDAQGAGSAVTYARRYSLCAALGIASDDDDDANAASRGKPQDDAAVLGAAMDEEARKAAKEPKPPARPLPGTAVEQAAFRSLCASIDAAETEADLDSLVPDAKRIAGCLKGNLRVVFEARRNRIRKGEKP